MAQVEFAVGDEVIATETDGGDGWSATWDSSEAVDGSTHSIEAAATDGSGQTASSPQVTVTLDRAAATTTHIADLDGISTNQAGTWTASVTVAVLDDGGHPSPTPR